MDQSQSSCIIEEYRLLFKSFAVTGAFDAEIHWVMNVIKKHSSYTSVEHDMEAAMCEMFPDSQIAQRMKLGKTKCMYFCIYGLGKYEHYRFLAKVKNTPPL